MQRLAVVGLRGAASLSSVPGCAINGRFSVAVGIVPALAGNQVAATARARAFPSTDPSARQGVGGRGGSGSKMGMRLPGPALESA